MPNRPKQPKQPEQPQGLYQGEFGDYAAKEDPLAYFTHVLNMGGRDAHNTNPMYWDWVQNQGFNNVWSDYTNAQANDERLSFMNFMNGGGTMRGAAPSGVQINQTGNITPRNPYAGNSVLGGVQINQRRR